MQIRGMKDTDYAGAYALWNGTKGMGMRSLDDSEEGVVRFLRRNPSTCFVAELDGKIIGTILCGHDGRRGYIYHLAVDVSARRRGMGGALADAALQALRAEGINKAALVVFCTNQTGADFWRARGFERRDDLYYFNRSLNAENE